MNKEEVVNHMVEFIENEEKNLQAAIMANEAKSAKADIVNRILKELEDTMPNDIPAKHKQI